MKFRLFKNSSAYQTEHGRVEEFDVAGRSYQAFVPNTLNANTPVLITHDAQNYLLDAKQTWNGMNWQVLEAINTHRISNHANRGLPLIVSIHLKKSSLRLNELAPEDFMIDHSDLWQIALSKFGAASSELMGNAYIDDVVANLMPEITNRFGVILKTESTAIAGSSMGGLASIYAMNRHPNVFGAALTYSTHWVIGENALVDYLVTNLPKDEKHIIWSDRGDLELDASYAPFHKRAEKLLETSGWIRDENFITAIFYGTGHREDYWARRVELPINWWLSKI